MGPLIRGSLPICNHKEASLQADIAKGETLMRWRMRGPVYAPKL